jgi:uncharacterized protein YmfQ (DUF2313 family)
MKDMEDVKTRSGKGGRPKKKVVKERTTGIRFSNTEYFIITDKAKKAGMKITSYIRQCAIESKLTTRLNDEERHFVRQLIGLSNNINQVARACHQEGILKGFKYFEQFRSQIDEILKKLKS